MQRSPRLAPAKGGIGRHTQSRPGLDKYPPPSYDSYDRSLIYLLR